jgi:hypothetical protein
VRSPRCAVRDFITAAERTVTAHGTPEMPVWGPLFRAFESDARTRVRIDNLVSYIESIQVPSPERRTLGYNSPGMVNRSVVFESARSNRPPLNSSHTTRKSPRRR